MGKRFVGRCVVALLTLITAVFLGCDENLIGLELPAADPETVLVLSHFDDENSGVGKNNYAELEQFDVVEGCIDLHGNGHYDVQPGNGIYIDMDGSCKDAGTLETKEVFELLPGERYLFEVWLAGNNREFGRDTMDVTIGSVYSEQFSFEASKDFELFTREISVSEPTVAKVRLEHYGGDDHGILVDLVRLRRVVE